MSDVPPANTFPYRRPKGSAPPPAERKPAHYRLSKDTWAIILNEYREGATVTALTAKWRVSAHALRKRITVHGATKRDWGDAQVIAQARSREAEAAAAWAVSPTVLASRLFEDDPDEDASAADPAALARQATRASGRAMRGRLWAEAKALAGLAESYRRLAAAETTAQALAERQAREGFWPTSLEEEERMREELYRMLAARAQAIDEAEMLEAVGAMAEALGVEGPQLEPWEAPEEETAAALAR